MDQKVININLFRPTCLFLFASVSLACASIPAPNQKAMQCCTFLAVGRQGYGDQATKDVANAMEVLAKKRGDINFALLLGDNFYPKGVSSIDDPQWQQKFESLYNGPQLKQLPFYVIAGNHDHQGDVNAELEYAKQKLGTGRWHMDGLYYVKEFGELDGKPLVRVVFLDSVRLHARSKQRTRKQQIALIRQAFINNGQKAHWNIIASHYPIRSKTRNRISRKRIMSDLLPLLKEAKVDLVLSANDRFQQIIDINGEALHISTNGGGQKLDQIAEVNSPSNVILAQRGFALVDINTSRIRVQLHDANGKLSVSRTRNK